MCAERERKMKRSAGTGLKKYGGAGVGAISLRLLERCQIRMDYGGVRKCLILGLRKTISSVLFLLMISFFFFI